ncbi:MAG TPA: DUF2975 domain-containing protein [Gemmatimonadaceae bacterium]|nr:DUF2975 domain-containing protein [Gemmatimonadaceae bacterium]
MTAENPDALSLSRVVLRALIGLNLGMGTFILVLLVASHVAHDFAMRALGGAHPGDDNHGLMLGMRWIMVIGLAAVPLMHLVLSRLLAIVETVRAGDPFVPENAQRLNRIAWSVLGLALMHVVVMAIARAASTASHPIGIETRFDLARWVTVLLLFVLARVFEHGTRLREDLQGTV